MPFVGDIGWWSADPAQAAAIPRQSERAEIEGSESRRILVNKSSHCIRFENETESEVTIVIEPKE